MQVFTWFSILASAMFVPALAGCESTGGHKMSEGNGDHVIVCKMCYDEAKTIRQEYAKGAQWSSNQVIKKHMCPDCQVEMTTYTQDGKPMIKCAKCAPEGMACDKCSPPKGKS